MSKKVGRQISSFFLIIILILFFTVNVLGVGLYPPQLRLENAPMGEKKAVATLTVVNTDDTDDYLVLKISCLESTRQNKLRVICTNCNRDAGIQRGDLINGTCPFCGANDSHLIKYDLPPDDVLKGITLSCEEYPLEAYKNATTYKTIGKIPTKKSADIDISVNIPDAENYYGQHWEARIMATTIPNLDELNNGMSMTYGAETKFLIDTQEWTQQANSEGAPWLAIGGIIGGIVVLCYVMFSALDRFDKKRELKKASLHKVKSTHKTRGSVLQKGRRIL